MQDKVQSIRKMKFFDYLFKLVPDDPLIQSRYVYYLTAIVFLGLVGYAINSWRIFFISYNLNSFFSGLFMLAIGLISLFGLKQTRAVYIATKEAYANKKKQPLESPEDMLKQFSDAKEI